ncbi:hypothetical protein A5660_16710 [Mycobacterium alsense]|nr:PPE family protein [Mycobacterium alsense]OBJ05299.1 hypothetical protein A5660_16710 [Mycobacterium alsense]
MDYAFFPPELISARIYSGPGSGSLLAAAGSWDSLSAELGTTAETYDSVLTSLSYLHWRGPASASMIAAAAPYVEWLNTTAQQTRQTAMQARAAAAAFDQAFAMTVPPPVIAANRAQLMALIATNFFGQNTAAIAATEAAYAEMWAQDALAMNTYAATQAATDPLSDLYSTLWQWTSQLRNGLGNLLDLSPIPLTPNGINILDSIQAVNTGLQGTGTMAGIPGALTGAQANLAYLSGFAGPSPALGPMGLGNLGGATPASGLAGLQNAVTASVGRGNAIGPMSVPASWSAPSTGRVAPLQPAGIPGTPG